MTWIRPEVVVLRKGKHEVGKYEESERITAGWWDARWVKMYACVLASANNILERDTIYSFALNEGLSECLW